MRRHFSPSSMPPPPGRYHHAVLIETAPRTLYVAGQLGIDRDGAVPEGVEAQAAVIFAHIEACLREAGMTKDHLVRLVTFITDIAHRGPFMRARDAWIAEPPPASTLVIVKGLVHPACLLEIEATAVAD